MTFELSEFVFSFKNYGRDSFFDSGDFISSAGFDLCSVFIKKLKIQSQCISHPLIFNLSQSEEEKHQIPGQYIEFGWLLLTFRNFNEA